MRRSRSTRALRVRLGAVGLVAAIGVLGVGCGDSGGGGNGDGGGGEAGRERPSETTALEQPVIDPGDGGNYAPVLDPANFVDRIDNPYLPFLPGSRWVYEGTGDGERERTEVVVTPERKQILGISAVVVRDTVTVGGELEEDTFDWFAQDREGNVWYLGEDVKNFADGELTDRAGSWEAGVDGAYAGIVMPARPEVGRAYRQEFARGEAEDMFEILRVDGTESVPFGSFDQVVVTKDWNPFEPEVVEEKSYAPGVGLVRNVKVTGGRERAVLVEYTPGS